MLSGYATTRSGEPKGLRDTPVVYSASGLQKGDMDFTFIAAIVIFLLPLVVILVLYLLRKRLGREGERRG